jgi:hypothetical protein
MFFFDSASDEVWWVGDLRSERPSYKMLLSSSKIFNPLKTKT